MAATISGLKAAIKKLTDEIEAYKLVFTSTIVRIVSARQKAAARAATTAKIEELEKQKLVAELQLAQLEKQAAQQKEELEALEASKARLASEEQRPHPVSLTAAEPVLVSSTLPDNITLSGGMNKTRAISWANWALSHHQTEMTLLLRAREFLASRGFESRMATTITPFLIRFLSKYPISNFLNGGKIYMIPEGTGLNPLIEFLHYLTAYREGGQGVSVHKVCTSAWANDSVSSSSMAAEGTAADDAIGVWIKTSALHTKTNQLGTFALCAKIAALCNDDATASPQVIAGEAVIADPSTADDIHIIPGPADLTYWGFPGVHVIHFVRRIPIRLGAGSTNTCLRGTRVTEANFTKEERTKFSPPQDFYIQHGVYIVYTPPKEGHKQKKAKTDAVESFYCSPQRSAYGPSAIQLYGAVLDATTDAEPDGLVRNFDPVPMAARCVEWEGKGCIPRGLTPWILLLKKAGADAYNGLEASRFSLITCESRGLLQNLAFVLTPDGGSYAEYMYWARVPTALVATSGYPMPWRLGYVPPFITQLGEQYPLPDLKNEGEFGGAAPAAKSALPRGASIQAPQLATMAEAANEGNANLGGAGAVEAAEAAGPVAGLFQAYHLEQAGNPDIFFFTIQSGVAGGAGGGRIERVKLETSQRGTLRESEVGAIPEDSILLPEIKDRLALLKYAKSIWKAGGISIPEPKVKAEPEDNNGENSEEGNVNNAPRVAGAVASELEADVKNPQTIEDFQRLVYILLTEQPMYTTYGFRFEGMRPSSIRPDNFWAFYVLMDIYKDLKLRVSKDEKIQDILKQVGTKIEEFVTKMAPKLDKKRAKTLKSSILAHPQFYETTMQKFGYAYTKVYGSFENTKNSADKLGKPNEEAAQAALARSAALLASPGQGAAGAMRPVFSPASVSPYGKHTGPRGQKGAAGRESSSRSSVSSGNGFLTGPPEVPRLAPFSPGPSAAEAGANWSSSLAALLAPGAGGRPDPRAAGGMGRSGALGGRGAGGNNNAVFAAVQAASVADTVEPVRTAAEHAHFKIQRVIPSGNCLFAAFGYARGDPHAEANAFALRRKVLVQLQALVGTHPQITTYLDGLVEAREQSTITTREQYYEALARSDFYGGDLELMVLSTMIPGEAIAVYRLGPEGFNTTYFINGNPPTQVKPEGVPLYNLLHPPNHFDTITELPERLRGGGRRRAQKKKVRKTRRKSGRAHRRRVTRKH